jgi:Carboxypeptidase regulatory-like domain
MRAARFILIALALCSLPVLADSDMTLLRIEVKTLAGKPIERASVIVRFVGGRSAAKLGRKVRTSWETRSNQDGVAKIPQIPKGKIQIQVNAKGYQTFGQDFQVEEDERTLEIKMNPPQPQYSVTE